MNYEDEDDQDESAGGFSDFIKSIMSSGGELPKIPGLPNLEDLANQAKREMTDRLLNETVERIDTGTLVSKLKASKCEMDLSAPLFISPGDILIRLTTDEIINANLPPFPYRFPRPGQPVEVIKIVNDPLPNSNGSVEDFIAKVNLYEVDCDSCPHHGKSHDNDPDCIIKVRDTLAYTMNSRYFKFYHE